MSQSLRVSDVTHPCPLCQASLITEYAAAVQPIQLAFQQQIQSLKTQHEEFVASIKQQPASVTQLATPAEPEKAPPMTPQAGEKTHILVEMHSESAKTSTKSYVKKHSFSLCPLDVFTDFFILLILQRSNKFG